MCEILLPPHQDPNFLCSFLAFSATTRSLALVCFKDHGNETKTDDMGIIFVDRKLYFHQNEEERSHKTKPRQIIKNASVI